MRIKNEIIKRVDKKSDEFIMAIKNLNDEYIRKDTLEKICRLIDMYHYTMGKVLTKDEMYDFDKSLKEMVFDRMVFNLEDGK